MWNSRGHSVRFALAMGASLLAFSTGCSQADNGSDEPDTQTSAVSSAEAELTWIEKSTFKAAVSQSRPSEGVDVEDLGEAHIGPGGCLTVTPRWDGKPADAEYVIVFPDEATLAELAEHFTTSPKKSLDVTYSGVHEDLDAPITRCSDARHVARITSISVSDPAAS